MIYAYGLKNYFSFKDGADVSFKFNNKVPDDISQGKSIATVLGVKGANGSGKTNLLKALDFLSEFCTDSFQLKDTRKIDADTYYRNKKPSEFYIEFTSRNTFYRFEIGVNQEQVIYERLYRKNSPKEGLEKSTRKQLIIERKNNSIIQRIDELSYLDVVLLKSNASIISTAYNYKLSGNPIVIHEVYDFFDSIRTNVGYTGLRDYSSSQSNIYHASGFYINNSEAFSFIKKIIIDSDLGISDIEIKTRKDEDGKEINFPIFEHKINNGTDWLSHHDESSGTKSLYIKLALYWIVLQAGGVLVLDEFDINCHALMLPKLVGLFTNAETNVNNSQFIFTSHNTEIIDTLGKYRTYLVNKEHNESFCYRLDEIKGDILRNGRLISPIYKEGKIGGVPKL